MHNIEEIKELYKKITETLIHKNQTITTMESMTSGLIASLITDTEGASAIFKGSLVTYSNEIKIKYGVPEDIINTYGVYSKNTAEAMAKAVCDIFGTQIGIGITGSAGNVDPVNQDSIPGKVYFSIYIDKEQHSFEYDILATDKNSYKQEAAYVCGKELLEFI